MPRSISLLTFRRDIEPEATNGANTMVTFLNMGLLAIPKQASSLVGHDLFHPQYGKHVIRYKDKVHEKNLYKGSIINY